EESVKVLAVGGDGVQAAPLVKLEAGRQVSRCREGQCAIVRTRAQASADSGGAHSRGSGEFPGGGQFYVPAPCGARGSGRELEAQVPVAPIDVRTEVERGPLGAEWVACRRAVAAFGGEWAGDAADRELAVDGSGTVFAQIDPCRAERQPRVLVCLEEVVAVDDVFAKLLRFADRDRLGDGARRESGLAIADAQPAFDFVARGTERRDDVLDGELNRRVDWVDVVAAGEGAHCCGHEDSFRTRWSRRLSRGDLSRD